MKTFTRVAASLVLLTSISCVATAEARDAARDAQIQRDQMVSDAAQTDLQYQSSKVKNEAEKTEGEVQENQAKTTEAQNQIQQTSSDADNILETTSENVSNAENVLGAAESPIENKG